MPNLYDENNKRINGYVGKNYMSKRIEEKKAGEIYQKAKEEGKDVYKEPFMSIEGKVKACEYKIK